VPLQIFDPSDDPKGRWPSSWGSRECVR